MIKDRRIHVQRFLTTLVDRRSPETFTGKTTYQAIRLDWVGVAAGGFCCWQVGCWWVLLLVGWKYLTLKHSLQHPTCAENNILRGYLRELANSCILEKGLNYALAVCTPVFIFFPSRTVGSTLISDHTTVIIQVNRTGS